MFRIRHTPWLAVIISVTPCDGRAQFGRDVATVNANAIVTPRGALAERAEAECKPWWVTRVPVDTLELGIVTGGIGDTEVAARESAEAKLPFKIAVVVSELVEGTISPAQSQKLRGSVEAFGSGFRVVEASDHCKRQVWVLAKIARTVLVERIESIDTLARGIDRVLLPALREQMRKNRPPSRPSLMFRSLYAPGSVQRGSGRVVRGWLVLGAVLGGGAAGLGGSIAAQDAANKATAETTNQTRRDHFNQLSDKYSSVSRTGWLTAGVGYALGLLDAASINPNYVRVSLVPGGIGFTISDKQRGGLR